MSLVVTFVAMYFSRATTANRFVVLNGTFESLQIGATKTAVLDVLRETDVSIAVQPVPETAPVWAYTDRLTEEERRRLTAAPAWISGDIGASTCVEDRTPVSTLRFVEGQLSRIEIVCVLSQPAAQTEE